MDAACNRHRNGTSLLYKGCFLWLNCLALISLTGLAASSEIGPFVSTGVITSEWFAPGRTEPTLRAEFSFRFAYSNQWWEAEVRRLNAAEGIGEIENCRVVPGGVRHYVLYKGQTNSESLNAASVCPQFFPSPTSYGLFLVWLSLCPSAQLPTLNETRIQCFLEDLPSCSDRLNFMKSPENIGKYTRSYLDGGSLFLESLRIWNMGAKIIMGNDSQPAVSRYSGHFVEGFMDSEFQVIDRKCYENLTFPVKTVYKHFAPNWSTEAPDDLYCSSRSDLRVDVLQFGIL